jgi:TPR repeat protein
VARCDTLAAHPDDPERAAGGIGDEQLTVKAAIAACADAVKLSPKLGRLHFQLGRALLEAQRVKEAVAALERAAALNHGGAFIYLANAYEVGGGGLPKSAAKAAEYHTRGLQLGFGSAPKASAASAGGKVLNDPAELRRHYEEGNLLRAVYYGDSSAVAADSLFVKSYLLAQVDVLVQMCRSFTIGEYRQYQAAAARSVMPRNERETMQVGMEALAGMARLLVDARTNPQSMVDAGMRQQRLEDAPVFGQKDLGVFAETYGGCGTPALERYTQNLRAFFAGSGTAR